MSTAAPLASMLITNDSQAGILIRHGSNSAVDIFFVVIVVFVLIAMCASLFYVCYAQLTAEQDERGGKTSSVPDRATISSVAFKVRKSIGLKHTEPEPGTARGRLQRQGTVGSEWYKLFEMCDQEGNGRIPVEIFGKFVQDKALRLGLKPSEATKVACEADINGDGFVDFTEFAETMLTVRKRNFTRGLSLKMSRQMMTRRQQTDATRESLDYSCCPPPIFLIAMTLLEVGVFFYQQDICGYQTFSDEDGSSICLPNALFANDSDHPFQIWRYLTSVLVHFDNVIGQLAFGTTLELAHRWRIAAVFLLGAITSALFEGALTVSHVGYSGGASGAVFAICAAHFANVTLNWNEMNHPIIHVALVMCFVTYTLFGMYCTGNTTSTSYSAHIGGFIAGILLGILFFRNVVQEKWEEKVKKAALILYISLVVFCIAGIVYRATDMSTTKAISSDN